jgi:hypothetical protein
MGRGKSPKSIALVEAARAILEEIQPASVRAVCYRLFVAKLIKDMSKNETTKVSKQLVWAREEGIIPWSWIVDETREAERTASWSDPDAILESAVTQYRKDYWESQPEWVEVWSEKGTVRGSIASVLNEYGITFRVMHGYSSATALQAVARETQRNPKRLTILYIGDWDPSGLNMSEADIPARLARYAGDATIRRIALDQDDVDHGNLPHFEAATKKGDSRYQWFVRQYGTRCWELDALPPPDLRKRVENAILEHLDRDAWEHATEIEAAEVESMDLFLSEWRRSISRQDSKYSDGEARP